MRVIAGKARTIKLKNHSRKWRHDQQQTVLKKLFLTFSSLKYRVVGFWICFPEAERSVLRHLSRGAEYAVFVEKNPKACTCIRENLSFTKLADSGKLLNMDVLQALRSLEGGERFDCIFMDPPYEQHLEQPGSGISGGQHSCR